MRRGEPTRVRVGEPQLPRRVAVVGTSGAGKTTFAREVARRLGVRHVEIDSVFWGPNWRRVPKATFLARLDEVLAEEGWVLCGNFTSVRERVWRRADTVVWLDYRLPVVLARLVRRTARRLRGRERLWGGNRETLERTLSPEHSILAWALRTHGQHRRRYPRLLREPRWSRLRVARLRSPAEASAWADALGTVGPAPRV
jgi:gluconate kinase